jgi:hypothetical protein
LAALSTSIRTVNPKAKIAVDRTAGKKVKFRLANGATCSACSLVTIETAFGMMSLYCLDTEAPSPILLSVKALKKLSAAIDFSTDTLACKGVDGEGKAFAIEKSLAAMRKDTSCWTFPAGNDKPMRWQSYLAPGLVTSKTMSGRQLLRKLLQEK